MEKIEYDDYMFLKVCQLVFVEKDCNLILEQIPNIFTIEFLIDFAEIIKQYCNHCFIGGDIKQNVLSFLNRFRFVDFPDETEDEHNLKINIINDIIININKQISNRSFKFYRTEMYKKTNNKSFLLYDYEPTNEQKEILNGLIRFDCAFLYTHSKYTSEEVFMKEYAPDLIGNNCYFQSVYTILNDAPYLFLNPTLKKRTLIILKEYLKVAPDKNVKKEIKKLERKINRGNLNII